MSIRRRSGWLSAVVLSAVIAGTGSLAGPVSAQEFRFNPGVWLEAAMTLNSYVPALGQAAQIVAGESQVSYSGKLTVLFVGTDWRLGGGNGERADSIMIVSVNPNNGDISAASIPRDTARIPLPPSLGGGIYAGKINGMFKTFKKQLGGNRNLALQRFKLVVEHVIGANIDYVAFLRFNGFDRLVDEAGGVLTAIPNEIRDPKYIDKPGWPTGAKFAVHVSPKALLKGASAERCYGGYPKPVTNWGPVMDCKRALVFVRSRKGKIVGVGTNTDFKRAARQQRFLVDAIKRVLTNGTGMAQDMRGLMNSYPSEIYTDMPTSNADITQMFNILSGANLAHSVVFGPSTYSSHIKGTSKYQLKLTAVRNWANAYFDDN